MAALPFFPFVQRRFVGKIFSLSGEAYPATNKTLRIKHSNNQFFKNKYVSWCLFCKQWFYLLCWQTVLKRNFVKRVCEIKHRGRFEEKNGFRINSRRGGNRGRDCEIILGSGGRYKGRLNGWSPHHQLLIHQSYLRHHGQTTIASWQNTNCEIRKTCWWLWDWESISCCLNDKSLPKSVHPTFLLPHRWDKQDGRGNANTRIQKYKI